MQAKIKIILITIVVLLMSACASTPPPSPQTLSWLGIPFQDIYYTPMEERLQPGQSMGAYLLLLNNFQYVMMRSNEPPEEFLPKLPGVIEDYPGADEPGSYRLQNGIFFGSRILLDSLALLDKVEGTQQGDQLDLLLSSVDRQGTIRLEAKWKMQKIHIPSFLAQLQQEAPAASAPPTVLDTFQIKPAEAGKDYTGTACAAGMQEFDIKSNVYLCHYDNGFTGEAASGWSPAMQYAWSRIAAGEICGNLLESEDTLIKLLTKHFGEAEFVHRLNGVGFHRMQIQRINNFCTEKRIAELQQVIPKFLEGKFPDPWGGEAAQP